ncbi:hypothetical protein C8R47DRAFT_1227114 [Mycena vitilis]|nr:hypothetical protein C8R47DRAFT_1227114 [Mycena vitilis]
MPPGLAKAFEPVDGGVGVGGGEEGEEVEDVVDVEVAVGAKRKGKRRASNEPAGNSAKRRPHRETSMPSIVIMQEQGTDAADGGERGAQTSPVEPPPSYSGHAAVDSSPPPDSMLGTKSSLSRASSPRVRSPPSSSLSGALGIFGPANKLLCPPDVPRGSVPPVAHLPLAADRLFDSDTVVAPPENPSGAVSGGGVVPPSADAMDTGS